MKAYDCHLVCFPYVAHAEHLLSMDRGRYTTFLNTLIQVAPSPDVSIHHTCMLMYNSNVRWVYWHWLHGQLSRWDIASCHIIQTCITLTVHHHYHWLLYLALKQIFITWSRLLHLLEFQQILTSHNTLWSVGSQLARRQFCAHNLRRISSLGNRCTLNPLLGPFEQFIAAQFGILLRTTHFKLL